MKEITGIRKVLFIGALLLTAIVMMDDSLIIPAAKTLFAEFDDEIGVNSMLNAPSFDSMLPVMIVIAENAL